MEEFGKKSNSQNQAFIVRKTNTNILPPNRRSIPNNIGKNINSVGDEQKYYASNQQPQAFKQKQQQHPNQYMTNNLSSKITVPHLSSDPIYKNSIGTYNNSQNQPTISQPFMFSHHNNFNSLADKPFTQPSNTQLNYNLNNNNNMIPNLQKNTEQNLLPLRNISSKQLESSTNFSSPTYIPQTYLNKQVSTQNMPQNHLLETLNQGGNSPVNQQLINELQQENLYLKKELAKNSSNEKDEKISKLLKENKKLTEKVNELTAKIAEIEGKALQQKMVDQQKQQRRQRQREEQEMERQYAYLLALDQMEQIQQPEQNDQPNVDQMTYEQLLNLQEQIGFVSKGMSQENINKIKEIRYDKFRMKDFCAMCSICQTDFEASEKLKELNPCKHLYHPDCINQWLQNEKNCPICKQQIQV